MRIKFNCGYLSKVKDKTIVQNGKVVKELITALLTTEDGKKINIVYDNENGCKDLILCDWYLIELSERNAIKEEIKNYFDSLEKTGNMKFAC